MNWKAIGLVAAVLLAAAGGTAYLTGLVGDTPTGHVVKDAFEMETGQDLEVLSVEDEGSFDRVVLSDGQEVIETFVTKDGQYIVNNPIDVDEYTTTLESRQDFLSCIEEQNAQFFGFLGEDEELIQHTQITQAQMQALGGINGLQEIFRGPGTEGFPEDAVAENGVVWRLNGELEPGVHTIPELEDATGCDYDGPMGG